ncbi:MAG: short-chain dehydrogenase [Gammaproteobacteria bacterium RIFCSPHIGHO2_12_FULL_35_23]|nr:MAG: short-chain dehydrogenase [Gammaproteobacteria bacterium RIFCSPHIGHO2_12_FULL_35_23]
MINKQVLITGAGSGLGRELSLWFANSGARLCLLSKSFEKLIELKNKINSSILYYSVDFEIKKNLDDVLTNILEKNFIPDIIIHCCGGGFGVWNPIESAMAFQKLLDLNLMSAIQINSTLVSKMIDQKKGIVIHIGSTASAGAHGSVAYNTVKAALAAYVRSLGRELAATGVVITGIAPGGFIAQGNNMSRFQQNKPEEFASYGLRLPAKRLVFAQEFIPVIKMLCEQKGPLFSGCMLPVDAGEGLAYTAH